MACLDSVIFGFTLPVLLVSMENSLFRFLLFLKWLPKTFHGFKLQACIK